MGTSSGTGLYVKGVLWGEGGLGPRMLCKNSKNGQTKIFVQENFIFSQFKTFGEGLEWGGGGGGGRGDNTPMPKQWSDSGLRRKKHTRFLARDDLVDGIDQSGGGVGNIWGGLGASRPRALGETGTMLVWE